MVYGFAFASLPRPVPAPGFSGSVFTLGRFRGVMALYLSSAEVIQLSRCKDPSTYKAWERPFARVIFKFLQFLIGFFKNASTYKRWERPFATHLHQTFLFLLKLHILFVYQSGKHQQRRSREKRTLYLQGVGKAVCQGRF